MVCVENRFFLNAFPLMRSLGNMDVKRGERERERETIQRQNSKQNQ